jgi:hypothetical protein
MLELEDDWDDRGSPGYQEHTWQRARDVLLNVAHAYLTRTGQEPTAPKVTPGPDGSIDIHWRQPDRDLVVNVPAAAHDPLVFYGETRRGATAKGHLDPAASNDWLVEWLKQ